MNLLVEIFGLARSDGHVVVCIANVMLLLLVPAHELGHAIAGYLVGLRQMKLIVLPGRRNPRKPGLRSWLVRYAASAAIDFSDAEFARLSRFQRRCVSIGGVTADVIVALVAFFLVPEPWAASAWVHGIVLGAWLRVFLGAPMNLIPNASVHNDGWCFMNPGGVTP